MVHFDSSGVDSVTGGIGLIARGFGGLPGLAGMAGAAIVAGVGAAAIASIKMAGDFQESMTQLVTGAGESKANLALVSNGILQMAQDTGTSTQQLAAGMYMIESAGYHGSAGLQVLQAAAEGAKVGNADLGTVADATTTILNDFGATGINASQAVNALITTVASGKTHMEDLSGSLSQILPTASAAGVSLQSVMSAMATMTAEGVPAANAATYLRQTILALDAPSTAAKKALESVGLSTQDVSTAMQKSLPDAIAMITDAVGKKFPVGSAAYVAAIKDISGGSKTMQGMLDLSGTHMGMFQSNFQNMTAAIANGKGGITGWSEVQGDLNQQLARLGEVVETAAIKFGTILLPYVTQAASWLADHLGPALNGVIGLFQNLVTPVQAVTVPLGVLKAQTMAAAQAGQGALSPFQQLMQNLQKLGPPIMTVAGAFGKDLQQAIHTLLPIVEQVALWFTSKVLPALVQVAGFIASHVIPVIIEMYGWWGQHVLPVLEEVVNVILTNVVPAMEKIWDRVANQLIPAIERLWNQLSPILIPALQLLGNIIQNVVGPAIEQGVGFLSNMIDGVTSLISWIQNLLNILGNVKNAIGNALGGMGNFLGGIASHIPGFASGVTNYSGGLAVVGEQGPELVYLPAGASVMPQSNVNLGSGVPLGSQQQQAPVNLYVDGRLLASTVWQNTPRAVNIATGYKG